MAITKLVRDQLLVQARHRCTICAEKCFEIHHIIEQAEGGTDDPENLIVLCPNCHQHRYHRSGEFTRDQLRLYKQRLNEEAEIEKRLLQNLEEIRQSIPTANPDDVEGKLRSELNEAAATVSKDKSPGVYASIEQTTTWLAERDHIRGGARRAIEIEWDIKKEQEKKKLPVIALAKVDHDAFRKAPDFPRAYYFELVLDQRPSPEWAKVFEAEYRSSFYSMKRKTELRGDRIVMVVADSDNLQGHADFAKKLVADTNQFLRTHGFQKIDEWAERNKREALQHFDAIQSMKARTKEIKL